MPRLLFGPARNKEDLVVSAVRAGFRGIDISSVIREANVGTALASLYASGTARESLFIQTKAEV